MATMPISMFVAITIAAQIDVAGVFPGAVGRRGDQAEVDARFAFAVAGVADRRVHFPWIAGARRWMRDDGLDARARAAAVAQPRDHRRHADGGGDDDATD